MKEKILFRILQLDIYGIYPRFTINGEIKFKTYFGSFMTLISILIIGLYFLISVDDIMNHKNPKLITTIYNDAHPSKRIITSKDFIITLSLQYSNYTNFIDERIYNIKAGLYTFYKINGKNIETRTPIDIIKCNEFNFDIIPSYFQSLDLNNLYCLKNGTFTIEGEYQSESFQFLYFNFTKCINSTLNNNSCFSQEKINSILSGGYIGIFMSDNIVIPHNFSIPYHTYGKNIFSTFSIKQYTDYWIYFKPMEVYTDTGFYFKSLKKDYFISYDRAESVIYYKESNSFANIIIRESTKREVHERAYIKIQEVAASAGGIVKIVTLLCEFIVYFFRQILYKNFMTQFFKFRQKKFFNINHKFVDTKSIIGNSQMKNIDSHSFRNNTSIKSNIKNKNLSNQNKIDKIKFQIGKNNSSISLKINQINNNWNNNINNNTNNNILNNSNNTNNNSNNFNFQKGINNKIPQKNDINKSTISGLNSLIFIKNMENNIITVKSSRNCFSIIFRKGCFKRIHYINSNYSKIDFLFDIVQFFKTKFEVKLIKNILFDEGERNKLSYLYKFNYDFDEDKEGHDIFYKKKNSTLYSSTSSQLKYKINN